MIVTSSGIVDGVIEDKYGCKGKQLNKNGMPTYSLPFKIEGKPEGTKSFAIILEDKDAFPVTNGFSWIHWTAANILKDEVKENESLTAKDFIQGVNSWMSIQGGSQSAEESSFYGGMSPPNGMHTYELHVFALDAILDIKPGFMLNELWWKMEGHILATYTLKGKYSNK